MPFLKKELNHEPASYGMRSMFACDVVAVYPENQAIPGARDGQYSTVFIHMNRWG